MQLLFPLMFLTVMVVGISTAFPDKSHLAGEGGDQLPDLKIKFPGGDVELEKPKPEEGRDGKAIVMAAARVPYGGGYGGYGYRGYGGYGYGYPGYYGGYSGYYGYPRYGYSGYYGYPYYG